LAEHGVFTNLSKAIDFNSNNNHVSFHNRLWFHARLKLERPTLEICRFRRKNIFSA
jgi:hypothetical protein